MSGYLYAVIFEQGTVKVGLSYNDVELRLAAHKRDGAKFGIGVWKNLTREFGIDHLELKENALCGYILKTIGKGAGGNEWFIFESPQVAETFIVEAFDKLENGELNSYLRGTYRYNENRYQLQCEMAVDMVKNGSSVPEVAGLFGIDVRAIYKRKSYQQWITQQQGEKQDV